jgi:hypothetical protein
MAPFPEVVGLLRDPGSTAHFGDRTDGLPLLQDLVTIKAAMRGYLFITASI